ncbi:hypothetical protein DV738_g140, partial [Chaetothyriales sp. CBS 135597]
MVFHGGFSRGCRTCLKRRVKCDEGKPKCQRCIKSKKECLGYRDDNDLAFKDETASTVRRANASEPRSPWSPTGSTASIRSPTTSTDLNTKFSVSQLSAEDMDAIEANAVQHFITHFAEPAARCNASQGVFPYTTKFYRNATPGSPIMLAIVALALTLTASSSIYSPSLLRRQARIRYGDTMRKVSEALNDPVESRSDGTIMTVLLLANIGTFLDTPSPIPHSIVHSTAAGHLLRAKGPEMAKDDELLQLLMRSRLPLAFSHTMRALPVQDLVDDNDPHALSWAELPIHVRTHPTHMLNSLILPVCGLRARVKALLSMPVNVSTMAMASSLVLESLDAESRLQGWLRGIPLDWKEEIVDDKGICVHISDTEVLWPCPGVRGLSRYRDAWVSNQHYTARDFRSFIQAMILRCAAWLSGMRVQDMSPIQIESNLALLGFPGLKPIEALQELIDSMCRSIFYNLGATPRPGQENSDTMINTSSNNSLHDLRPALGGPFLTVRPLMIANSAIVIPAAQQLWIKSVLRIVGNELDVSTASIIAATPLGYEHPLFGS